MNWTEIIASISENPREFHTTAKSPLWYYAEVASNGKSLLISNAEVNTPSVSLKQVRRIYEKDFDILYPFYLRRENGESIHAELSQTKGEAKKQQTYLFGIIRSFKEDNNNGKE